MFDIKVTYKIKEYREKVGFSYRQLSLASGISHSQIMDIEHGEKHPTVYTLCCIAAGLNVDPKELFEMTKL